MTKAIETVRLRNQEMGLTAGALLWFGVSMLQLVALTSYGCGTYLKFEVLATKAPSSGTNNCNWPAVADYFFYEYGTALDSSTMDLPNCGAFVSGNPPTPAVTIASPSEDWQYALDANQATKFISTNEQHYLKIKWKTSRCVTSYKLRVAADAGTYGCRNPNTWLVSYSSDAVNWVLLDSRLNAAIPDTNSYLTSEYNVGSPAPTTSIPSKTPTKSPATSIPSESPTLSPMTSIPSISPTRSPSTPTTFQPSVSPSSSSPSLSPSTSQPSRSPSGTPSNAPTTSGPTKSPTLAAPEASSIMFSEDLSTIFVDFDKPTNQGVYTNRVACLPGVEVSFEPADVGCGGSGCPVICQFIDNQRLVVNISPLSNFTSISYITINEAASIGALVSDAEQMSPLAMTMAVPGIPEQQLLPTIISITGPKIISTCATSPFSLTSSLAGVATITHSTKLEWYENDALVGTGLTYRLIVGNVSRVSQFRFRYATWAGGEVWSAPFDVTFTTAATASVFLTAPIIPSASSSQLIVNSAVSVSTNCLPLGFTSSNINYSYTWTVEEKEGGSPLNLTLIDTNGGRASYLKIIPPALIAPGRIYTVSTQVTTGIPGLVGDAAIDIIVQPELPVAIISNSSSIVAGGPITLSAIASCDPNIAHPRCVGSVGVVDARESDIANKNGLAQLAWSCLNNEGERCQSAWESSDIASCFGQMTCELNPADFTGGNQYAPFTVTMFAYSATLPEEYSSASVQIVLQSLSCPLPSSMAISCPRCVNNRVNPGGNAALVLLADMPASWLASNGTRSVQWFIGNSSMDLVPFGSPIDLLGGSASGATLILPASLLITGSSYTIQAVSYQSCGTKTSALSGQLTISVNSPPQGGSISVSPLVGDINTWFTATCGGFDDTDQPLSYSVFKLTDKGWAQQTPFSRDATHELRLPANITGHTIACVAKDSLAAVSPINDAPMVSGIVVSDISLAELLTSLDDIDSSIDDALSRSTNKGPALSLVGSFASALQGSNTTQEQLDNARTRLLGALARASDNLSPEEGQQMLNVAATLLSGRGPNVTGESGKQVASAVTNLVGDIIGNLKESALDGDNAVDAEQAIDATGQVLSQVLSAFQELNLGATRVPATRAPVPSPASRRLEGASLTSSLGRLMSVASGDDTVQRTRKVLRDMVDLLLVGVVSGEPPKTLPLGLDIKIVAVVASPGSIGGSLSTIVVPGFNETVDQPSVFYLPGEVLAGSTNDSVSSVNVVAVRFRFNIRELVDAGELNFTLDPLAPINAVEEIVALDFQRPSEPNPYHPSGLIDPIRLRVPLRFDQLPPDNTTQLACGYWDESQARWSSFGCNVTSFSLPANATDVSGWLECSCNHASDYAAWQAFVADVTSVFDTPVVLGTLSTIAALVCGVLLPAIVVGWLLFSRLGRRMDLDDSRRVHLGTFVTITSRKIQLHARQRRFFQILRENKGLSVKELVRRQKELAEDQKEQRDAMETTDNLGDEQDYYKKTILLMITRTLALLQAFSVVLTVAGLVAARFTADSPESLSDLAASSEVARTTQALGAAVAFITLASAVATVVVLSHHGKRRGEFGAVWALASLSMAVSLPMFSVPLAEHLSAGTGLNLLIAAGSINIISFFIASGLWFVRTFSFQAGSILGEFLVNCGKGLAYEQSLISILTRFDPYLDRQKRFSLLVAIIVGNLFANSFFFSLKTATDVSLSLTIGTVILSAFIIAVPVKFTIRFLFKVSTMRNGSVMDRVAQIFRIVAFSNDVHPAFANEAQKMDVQLLDTFKRFYILKHQVKMLEKAFAKQEKTRADLDRIARGLPPKGTYEYWLPRFVMLDAILCLLASGLIIAGLVVTPYASSGPDPNPTANTLGALCVFACVTIAFANVLLVLGKGKTPRAPSFLGAVGSVHFFLALLSVLLIAIPLGRDKLRPEAGLNLVIAGSALTWCGLIAFTAALYIYLYCAPEMKRIRRFYRVPKANESGSEGDYDDDLLAQVDEVARASSGHKSTRRAQSERIVMDEGGAVNPIARSEVSAALRSTVGSVDRKTQEFDFARQVPLGLADKVHSKRLERNVSTFARITHHDFLEKTLAQTNGVVTPELLNSMRAQLDITKKELKRYAELSRIAWTKLNPVSLSAKQLAVRREKRVMLKLATLLAEETGPRPRHIKRWFPSVTGIIAWSILMAFYIGCLTWIVVWIFTRDAQSEKNLISSGVAQPTRQQIAETTNVVMASWLGAAFLSVFIGYFVAEPLLIIFRYGILPLCIRMYRGESASLSQDINPISSERNEGLSSTKQIVDVESGAANDDHVPSKSRTCAATPWCCSFRAKTTNHARNDAKEAGFAAVIFDAVSDFVEAVA